MSVAKFIKNSGTSTEPGALPDRSGFGGPDQAATHLPKDTASPGEQPQFGRLKTVIEPGKEDRDQGIALDRELLDAIGNMIPQRRTLDPQSAAERNQTAIRTIMMRLSDILFLSNDMIAPQEKALADDLLARLFERAERATQFRIVERMLHHADPPPALVRTMLHSEDEIALPLLRSPLRLKQADLISVVRTAGTIYQRAVAERVGLESAVCDALIQCADVPTIRIMLRNRSASISRTGFIRLAEMSIKERDVLEPLVERLDFPADMAHLVFWWSPTALRKQIIERFASPRQTIFEVVPQTIVVEIDELMPEVANALRMVRKAQRVPYDQIDAALMELGEGDANVALDILSDAAHLRAETIAQILDDAGGEAVGVFCKATGFGKERFYRLRQILAHRRGLPWDLREAKADDVTFVHDTLSTDKADLILRYWDRATREVEF